MWRPMEVKNHWEIQKKNVETNGGEKPLGNQKKTKNKMWRPMGVKNHWEIKKTIKKQNVETNGGEKPLGNQKKQKKKCGDLWPWTQP